MYSIYSLLGFDGHTQPSDRHHNQEIGHIQSPQKVPLCPFIDHPHPTQATIDLISLVFSSDTSMECNLHADSYGRLYALIVLGAQDALIFF